MDPAALVALILDIGQHDREHAWYVHPVLDEENRASPLIGTLGNILDMEVPLEGHRGWVIYRDAQPLIAVVGDRMHFAGKSSPISTSLWMAVGGAQFLLDAAKNVA